MSRDSFFWRFSRVQPHSEMNAGRYQPYRMVFEPLESRRLLSAVPPPDPIIPNNGETNLLGVVQMHADKQHLNAQDHFPVPFVIVASAEGAEPVIKNWKAGHPARIDADDSKSTGKGGHDIKVEVNTDLYTDDMGNPAWQLRLNVDRIGTANFAEELSVYIAFPFDAFNTETDLAGPPNLLMGFETRLPGTPGTDAYKSGIDGGIAPESVEMVLTSHVLAGTEHDFEWDIATSGAANPLTFVGGEFDGDPVNLTQPRIENAIGFSAYVEDVPDQINVDLSVSESKLNGPASTSFFDMLWTASDTSLVNFTYIEAETSGAAQSPEAADFLTELVADEMPTSEHFVLLHDEAAGELTMDHDANAPIGEMTFLKKRSDGLAITAQATDVPTDVELTLGLSGNATLQVDDKFEIDDNTLDMLLQASQLGDFNSTSSFLGYDLGYVSLDVVDAPDLTASFDGGTKSFTTAATNPGEQIPLVELLIDGDGEIGSDNVPLNLELPVSYFDDPTHHLFSLVDNGLEGTAVARVLETSLATYDHDAPDIKESLDMHTGQDVPMQVYLRTGVDSNILPPPGGELSPDPFVEVTCDIDDVPAGHSVIELDLPMTFTTQTESEINELKCLGHIGDLKFGILLGEIPTNSAFDFRPEGSLDVKALDANGTPDNEADDLPDAYGIIATHLSDSSGFDPNVLPWPVWNETFFPDDTRLQDARLRLDDAPSLSATWNDGNTSTVVDLDTALDATIDPSDPFAYVGGFQVAISTITDPDLEIDCDDLLEVPEATDDSEHYALLKDVAGEQTFTAGVFGPDQFHFDSDDTKSPSTYRVDFHLDPDRPFTAAQVNVDTNPTATGALGTFFGGDEVFGPLTVAYVPSEMHVDSDLDPGFCTTGLFPPIFPIPSDIDQQFTVAGTQVFVHARDLAPRFCVNWDITGATTEIQVESTDLALAPSETGLIEVLFQNPSGLPGGGALFADPANPLTELRVRLDEVPSVTTTVTTTGNTHINIDTDNPAPFNILGGLRLNASTIIGPNTLPTYPPLVGNEKHTVSLHDDGGSNKEIDVQIIGLDELDILVNSGTSTLDFSYDGDVDRQLEMLIDSNDGRFFADQQAQIALLVDDLPQSIDLSVDTRGYGVSSNASTGINQIRLGGPGILGAGPLKGRLTNLSPPPADDFRFSIDIDSLPAVFDYSLDPTGSLSIVANPPVGSIIGRVENSGGFTGTDNLIGADPLQDVRFRLDSIPSLDATWSSGGGTNVLFDTVGANYLGGAQIALSTETTTSPFPAPSPTFDQEVTFADNGVGTKKELIARIFGIDRFEFVSTETPRNLELDYRANQDRQLVVDVDATFDNVFFPDNDVDAVLTITNVPQTWNLTTDLATQLDFTGSGGLDEITVDGEVGVKEGMTVHTTDVLIELVGLPQTVHFLMVPELEGMAELTLSNPIDMILAELKSDTKILGEDYRHIRFQIDDIPANWNADWGEMPSPHAILMADQPLGPVSLILSKDVAANTPSKYTVFENAGSTVEYTDYSREIDRRYFRDGVGDPDDREAAFMSRLDALYDTSTQLDNDEDHLIYRKDGDGELSFLSLQATGFECVAAQVGDGGFQCGPARTVNGGELNASLEIDFPGDHPFYVGMENTPGEFLTVQVDNVPDNTSAIVGLTRAHIDFDSSPGDIVVYQGPLPQANEGQEALKVRVSDAPEFIHADWDLDINGSITLNSSDEVEVAIVAQDGSSRTVADFSMEDLIVDWGFDTFDPELVCETFLGVPVACSIFLNVIQGHANITAEPEVEGFAMFYDFIGNAQDLSGSSPARDDNNEYVPRMSFIADGINDILSLEAGIRMCIVPVIPLPPIPHPQCAPFVPLPYLVVEIGALSDVNFDWWDLGGDFPFDDPDYVDNDPWDIWPLFHGQSDHKFPFGPPLVANAVPATDAPIPDVLTEEQIAPIRDEAISRWRVSGATFEQISQLQDVDIRIVDLPGDLLAQANRDRILVDRDAAGWGWFVDETPSDDVEFIGPDRAAVANRMDLISVLFHEMGHLLGFEHGSHEGMRTKISPGERTVINVGHLDRVMALAPAAVLDIPNQGTSSPAHGVDHPIAVARMDARRQARNLGKPLPVKNWRDWQLDQKENDWVFHNKTDPFELTSSLEDVLDTISAETISERTWRATL